MWPDHETDLDLLGLDYLVDELVVALTEPRLLPLTIGVLGDWGSGKSSMLALTRRELAAYDAGLPEGSPRHLFVRFSPWQHEDYDDVKTALMTAVVAEVRQAAPENQKDNVGLLTRLIDGMRRRSRTVGRTGAAMLPAAGAFVLAAADPSAAAVTADLVNAGTNVAAAEIKRALADPPTATDIDIPADAAEFRRVFKTLLNAMPNVAAVVVLIDDLDRCLPGTVVDTFEAMRLFLQTPKTAWVVAAHQAVVESAIDSLYPDLKRPDGTGIGADYLEKMVQLRLAVPALSAPEAMTYINLLLAELHLGRDSREFEAVLAKTRENRAASNLTVAFNLAVASEALGVDAVPEELSQDLSWAGAVGPAIAAGLGGNPRRIKRFLNTLSLRHRAAARRDITLRHDVLAKLTLLEERHLAEFQRVYEWQLAATGPAPELADAERIAAGKTDEGKEGDGREISAELRAWAAQPRVTSWLQSSPQLTGLDLRPYFTYARDKLSPGAAEMLPPAVQAYVARLLETKARARHAVADEVAAASAEQRGQVVQALIALTRRTPDSEAFSALADIASRAPDVIDAVIDAYIRLPHTAVPVARVAAVLTALPKDHPAVHSLSTTWSGSTVEPLARIAGRFGSTGETGR